MPGLRFFYSSASNDWMSPLLVVSRGLASVSGCVPFPYVNTALAGGVALLELIQTVGKNTDDLKYLAESVVTIMKLLREEMDAHPDTPDAKFRQVCVEFNVHLSGLSKDIETMSKDWSSSRFKKYLKANAIRDEIAQFTRRVNDLRADATFVAAVGTRVDLVEVKSSVSEIQKDISAIRSATTRAPSSVNQQDLVRFEEDFHALKVGDIQLEFETARKSEFVRFDRRDGQKLRVDIGWTDYKGIVNGSVRTIRVYQGSDPSESWKEFLSLLADHSPAPHLPQLFGFCSSPRLKSLVFHGEFKTLDEYGRSLRSSHDIVNWEMTLMSDFSDARDFQMRKGYVGLYISRHFALVHAQNGKLVVAHVESSTTSTTMWPHEEESFLYWFVYSNSIFGSVGHGRVRQLHDKDSTARMQAGLSQLKALMRTTSGNMVGLGLYQSLTSRGSVSNGGCPVARLENCEHVVDAAWGTYLRWIGDFDEEPDNWFYVDARADSGWTHFRVPLIGKTRNWTSLLDRSPRCGYFFSAQISFGENVPDITDAWISQSGQFVSNQTASRFLVPIRTQLQLMWEMVLVQEETATTPESLALLETLPEELHVFVQVPTLDAGRIAEPKIYWSTDPTNKETSLIPSGAFKIRVKWAVDVKSAWWQQHHYDVAKSIQEECGFDPSTNAAAKALNLPLLQPCHGSSIKSPYVEEDEWFNNWFTELDPHTHYVQVIHR
ncbi:hypothetical protein C8R44DRAFT_786206 [Mycena epipterygia]|nr:hypothetical protein C8R44DRAFT_786206 [Mycena epipterygia]